MFTVLAALEKFYSELANGNPTAAATALPENISFAVAGKSSVAGKYNKQTFFSEYLMKLRELSGGELKMEIHDILGSDRHATALLTYSVTRDGTTTQVRSVHVWRAENGKLAAGYEYPRDMYQFDLIWS